MSQIILGKQGRTNVTLDLGVLLTTRLLLQANSGGGKSWALRRLAEQIFGKVQVVIIDPEGEFPTLREKFDYLLVGQGGETPADLRSAKLLAEKLLELRFSAVCDLYEAFRSRPLDQRAWVRIFLETLIDAPKKYWRPLIVIVDEAHKFCPQESPKGKDMREREIISGTKDAMVALATTGRKRGFCPIWATQRLAKLDKDASAELFNRLVGMTIEDVDVDRACDLMSVSREDKQEFRISLRNLEPGNFYAFGRAITKVRLLMKVGGVATTHPESGAGKQTAEPPPPPEKIRALLPKLGDLPKLSEEKAKSEAELKKEIRTLRAQLREQPAKTVQRTVKISDPHAVERAVREVKDKLGKAIKERDAIIRRLHAGMTSVAKQIKPLCDVNFPGFPVIELPPIDRRQFTAAPIQEGVFVDPDDLKSAGSDNRMPVGERAILTAAAQYEAGTARDQLTILTGYKRSSRDEYIRRLLRRGYVEERGGTLLATDAGIAALGSDFKPLPVGGKLQTYWLNRLPEGEAKIFKMLLESNGESVLREDIEAQTGYKRSSRDEYLRRLSARRLVELIGRGEVRAAKMLFEGE